MKKLPFQLVFSTYLHVVLLKFQLGALFRWGIQFRIQQVPTWHTFGGPRSTKKQEIHEKCNADINIMFFMYFLFFRGLGYTKSMPSGYSLDAELHSQSKFE